VQSDDILSPADPSTATVDPWQQGSAIRDPAAASPLATRYRPNCLPTNLQSLPRLKTANRHNGTAEPKIARRCYPGATPTEHIPDLARLQGVKHVRRGHVHHKYEAANVRGYNRF
jgi:hypothetical protein